MFDARSILDALVRGGSQSPSQGQQGDLGPLSDLLGQLARGGSGSSIGGSAPPAPAGGMSRDDAGADQAEAPRGGIARGGRDTNEPYDNEATRGRRPGARDADDDGPDDDVPTRRRADAPAVRDPARAAARPAWKTSCAACWAAARVAGKAARAVPAPAACRTSCAISWAARRAAAAKAAKGAKAA